MKQQTTRRLLSAAVALILLVVAWRLAPTDSPSATGASAPAAAQSADGENSASVLDDSGAALDGAASGSTTSYDAASEDAVQPGSDAESPSRAPTQASSRAQSDGVAPSADAAPNVDGSYTSKEDITAYLLAYGRLPDNFITKQEAEALGWSSSAGNLDDVAPGKSIGGDRFGNYEGLLPTAPGRTWRECDVGYTGGYRGAQRILYASDGLIYYTDDHYETFTQLVGPGD